MSMPMAEAFVIYSHKAPVRVPGSQQVASRAYRALEPHLLQEERVALAVARSHALHVGEGRFEFDAVCKCIGVRLGLVDPKTVSSRQWGALKKFNGVG